MTAETIDAEVGFNSILVRLKELFGVSVSNKIASFQFHSGAIKSRYAADLHGQVTGEFQFHSGAIKSATLLQSSGNLTCFNSILVRLKAACGWRLARGRKSVSIPFWCD